MTHRRSGVLQLAAFAALLALAHPLTLTAGNGDYDLDNDIDWDDFANWALCMTGSNGGPLNPDLDACSVFDFDGDFDVDLVDFGAFQAAFQKPPAAACQRYNGNSRLYAGATKYVPTNSNHGAAIGGTAKITQPFHKMKLCGEPAGLKKTAQSSVVFGVTEDDIIFGQYIWWFQIGYARRRFEHPHGPYLPGVMFDGLFAESKNRGFYNLAVSNYAPPPQGHENDPSRLWYTPPEGDHPDAVGLPPPNDGVEVLWSYWSYRGLGGQQLRWYFKVGSETDDMNSATLFHYTDDLRTNLFRGNRIDADGEIDFAENDIAGSGSNHCKFTDIKYRDSINHSIWRLVKFQNSDLIPTAKKAPQGGQTLSDLVPEDEVGGKYKTVEIWDTSLNPQ